MREMGERVQVMGDDKGECCVKTRVMHESKREMPSPAGCCRFTTALAFISFAVRVFLTAAISVLFSSVRSTVLSAFSESLPAYLRALQLCAFWQKNTKRRETRGNPKDCNG